MSFIPDKDADFNEWQANFVVVMSASSAGWNIPAPDVTIITDLQGIWTPAYAAGNKNVNRTPSQTLAKTESRDDYESGLRSFIKSWISFNPEVTNEDRVELKVTVRDTTPSSRPAITTVPRLSLTTKNGSIFIVENRVASDSSRPSMHVYADLVELCYKIGGDAPVSPDECEKFAIFSKATQEWSLDPAVGGSRIWVYSRWVNKTDAAKNSGWSTVREAIISI